MTSRRPMFKDIKPKSSSHAGLWLDKYICTQKTKDAEGKDTEARRNLVEQVSQIAIPVSYAAFFQRWRKQLEEYGATTRTATVSGRMIVGLGNESVLETSVTLHRTYGVPYIPGSALKGLAASYARHYLGASWHKESKAYKIVFGDTESAGYITFFDALYIPESGKNRHPLAPDVITVHHQEYYGDTGAPPADWDSPNPVPFLSATGDYLLALAGEDAWVQAVFTILTLALRDVGIGAKTSSGYGRMAVEDREEEAQLADPEQQQIDALLARLADLPENRVAGELHPFVVEWRSLNVRTELKQRVAQSILDKVREAGREKKSAEKGWFKELNASLEQSEA